MDRCILIIADHLIAVLNYRLYGSREILRDIIGFKFIKRIFAKFRIDQSDWQATGCIGLGYFLKEIRYGILQVYAYRVKESEWDILRSDEYIVSISSEVEQLSHITATGIPLGLYKDVIGL